jgi:hypothetical protein
MVPTTSNNNNNNNINKFYNDLSVRYYNHRTLNSALLLTTLAETLEQERGTSGTHRNSGIHSSSQSGPFPVTPSLSWL